MRGDAVTLGDLVGKITMLEVACRRCERRGRLRLSRLIEQHGDMRLILPRDCPKAEAPSVGERCSIYFPQLLPKNPADEQCAGGQGST